MNLLASLPCLAALVPLAALAALDGRKHFGRAAQACHITQPALAHAPQALHQRQAAAGFQNETRDFLQPFTAARPASLVPGRLRWAKTGELD